MCPPDFLHDIRTHDPDGKPKESNHTGRTRRTTTKPTMDVDSLPYVDQLPDGWKNMVEREVDREVREKYT